MIRLALEAQSDAPSPFVTRLSTERTDHPGDSLCLSSSDSRSLWCGSSGLIELDVPAGEIAGDVILVDPRERRAERLLRAGSRHNSLLVTEQCDQLCMMCSQPPKKTHHDRFELFRQACHLAEAGSTIGITGGEPTLHLEALLAMIEDVLAARPDLSFHVLSNGQHFESADALRLRSPDYRRVVWGIPLYAADPELHDDIVGKKGAFERLHESFEHLLLSGARIELRTVLTCETLGALPALACHVSLNLAHVEQWSLMGLENIGFARNRWELLYPDLRRDFQKIGLACDLAALHGVPARLFNIPLCHVPEAFRHLAVASISDWKQKFAPACDGCRARADCAGFFEWHPPNLLDEVKPL